MTASGPPILDLLSARQGWLAARQAVLAQNIANADTPHWQARDVVPFSRMLDGLASAVSPLALAATDGRHLEGEARAAGQAVPDRAVSSYEVTPTGNGVVIDEQMEKLAATEVDHRLATDLYKRYVAMLRTALGTSAG
jgi:flagellar basal-body rod protein FlgB